MNPRVLRWLALPLALVLRAAPVSGQGPGGALDHLLCYAITDNTKVLATVDLAPELQPEFRQSGCTVIKPTKFCVPATKRVTTAGSTGPDVIGQPLQNDYVCYLLKCPKTPVPIPGKMVADQFGRRVQQRFRPSELCVPARKAPPPCQSLTGAKQCSGVCPPDASGAERVCRYDRTMQECTCAPDACGGKPDKTGQCGGACPDPAQTCRPGADASGKPACVCQDLVPPPCDLSAATGTCGGTCPNPADTCVFVAGTATSSPQCICQPPVDACQQDAGGQCGGPCPPGLRCALDTVVNQCRCVPEPLPCGPNIVTGQCGGDCPPGSVCRLTAGTAGGVECGCIQPCGLDALGQCGGDCPPGLLCRVAGTGSDARCRCN